MPVDLRWVFGSNQLRVNTMSVNVFHPHAVSERFGLGIRLSSVLLAVSDSLSRWRERSRQRRMLGRLDDRMLRDVGLSRADVEQEVSKPFWQV